MKDNRPSGFDSASALELLARQLQLPRAPVAAVIGLLESGNTIPFIARYRKEATGGLDETVLRAIEDGWERILALQARRETVLQSIAEQGLLSDALRRQIGECSDLRSLEELYLPFRPKRRTRATIAREQGLQPLADLLLQQAPLTRSRAATLQAYVDPAKGVPDAESALRGALDIVAEHWSLDPQLRSKSLDLMLADGRIVSRLKRGQDREAAARFETYFEHEEPLRKLPSHRLLAMLRGEDEGMLKVSLEPPAERMLAGLRESLALNRQFPFFPELNQTVADCCERLLVPATESAAREILKERADEDAIGVFGKNLRELLLAPPAGPRVTIGMDPGFRTGCKLAVVDGTGRFLEEAVIYPTPPRNDLTGASAVLLGLIQRHGVELIAIGNGTAGRETEAFVSGLIREHQLAVTRVMVSEAGASIYSASELAAEEFPQLDVTVRGAISIARRLQDPLAELVKSDPKTIGVGQYQYDVNQPRLRKCLDRTVESCVHHVGVDLNMASVPLLSRVAGIGPRLAANIVELRNRQGPFTSRRQLLSVPKLGKKAFEQAAGFLRIRNGDEPLDNSAVHPECYPLVARMARQLGTTPARLVGNPGLSQQLRPEEFVEGAIGLPTILDIIAELAKPGRDPRSQFRTARFDESVHAPEDLRPGMVLEGVITNVTHFGAFVDVGVHQDALIHISQLSHEYVRDPSEVVTVGEITRVKVLEVDLARKRISVTRKF